MTTSAILKSIDRDRVVTILEAPSNAEVWDLAGQDFIRLQDMQSALRSFKRSEVAGPPFLQNYLYRLAMALEISGELDAAATRYIRIYEEKSEHSRDALYRAIGCLHRTNAHAAIVALLGNLRPSEWRGYQELGLIGGLAFSEQGDISRAASWLFIEPDITKRCGPAWDLLSQLIASGASIGGPEDVKRFLHETAHSVFQAAIPARKVLRWIIRSGHANTLATLIAHPTLIQLSNGQNLSHASIFIREWGLKEAGLRAARMALVMLPDNPTAVRAILPNASEPNQAISFSETLWAKTAIILPDTEDVTVNEAVITLKTAELENLTTLYLKRAAERFKASPSLLYNVGSHFNEKALAEMAEPVLRRAVILEPGYAKAWSSYTVALCTQLESERGVISSHRALAADPKLQSGYTNLAMAYRGTGELDLAISAGKQQLRISPKDATARMGVAFNQLSIGAIEEGFENYLCRWAQPGFPSAKRPFPQAEWTLQKIPKGKKVLIYMEQGMGDELMFSWFLKYAEEHASGQIVVECDPRLIPVFERSFPTIEFWPMTGPAQKRLLAPDILYKIPIGHLPSMFTSQLRELIKERWSLALNDRVRGYGWIVPDAKAVCHWRNRLQELGADNRMCIGISWRSGNQARARVSQYLNPHQIVDSLPDNCIAVVLQYVYEEDEFEEIRREAAKRGIDVVVFDGLDLKNDLADVIDLCAAVDVIVTPLTSIAFMGGVIGTPTWVFRTSASLTIWQQLGTPHIPWIPSIQLLFRRPQNLWDEVVQEMRKELSAACDWFMDRSSTHLSDT
ncbi:hypothetical protein [Nisaea sp.]|uniref:hypothetical protein n=1 Tax=Nisaea sp. TaxID=2024842 RepID=UPI002B265037|nr:hypothetical protein [Nisaea sp.]